jgi:hypothetical protein
MPMIEVFKTDVTNREKAKRLIEEIHKTFVGYKANFDLDDCDKVLRVVSSASDIEQDYFIGWLKKLGCNAEILPDN